MPYPRQNPLHFPTALAIQDGQITLQSRDVAGISLALVEAGDIIQLAIKAQQANSSLPCYQQGKRKGEKISGYDRARYELLGAAKGARYIHFQEQTAIWAEKRGKANMAVFDTKFPKKIIDQAKANFYDMVFNFVRGQADRISRPINSFEKRAVLDAKIAENERMEQALLACGTSDSAALQQLAVQLQELSLAIAPLAGLGITQLSAAQNSPARIKEIYQPEAPCPTASQAPNNPGCGCQPAKPSA